MTMNTVGMVLTPYVPVFKHKTEARAERFYVQESE